MSTMRVLLLAPWCHAEDVGEAFVSFKWAEALSRQVDLTVLCLQRQGRPLTREQLPHARVIDWPEPAFLSRFERFNAMFKPAWPLLMRNVRRFVRTEAKAGRHFDIAHQITPVAARYPCPFYGTGLPYIVGPVGGALPTPPGFRGEMASARWFTKLRGLDGARFARDPWLRRSFANAEMVLGVAPYIRDVMHAVPMKRFESVLELGVDDVPPYRPRPPRDGLRILHVGRAVRTKGLRDLVRAMAHLKDRPDITLTSAGGGEELDPVRAEAAALGVSDRITFLGQVPKSRVMELYEDADAFVFPSFREPTGGVLYEAMRAGLPILTVAYGGPEAIVNDTCAIRLPLSTPEALSADLATAIRDLAADPDRRAALGQAAHAKVAAEGLWPAKASQLTDLYDQAIRSARRDA